MTLKTTLLALTLALSTPAFAAEKTGTEMLFDTAALATVETGTTLRYSHTRTADENIPIQPLNDRQLVISIVEGENGPLSRVQRMDGKSPSGLQEFRATNGNPIPPIFLTSSVRATAFATKGSGFYIKNRFQEAIYNGGEVTETEVEVGGETLAAQRITYRPFTDDPNAKKMGQAFEALVMTVVLSDAVPGKLVSMTTRSEVDGVEYFNEEITFLDAEKD